MPLLQARRSILVVSAGAHLTFEGSPSNINPQPLAGAFEALKRLGHEREVDLVVVTSRQHVIQDHTLTWIDKHFPGIFQVGRAACIMAVLNELRECPIVKASCEHRDNAAPQGL